VALPLKRRKAHGQGQRRDAGAAAHRRGPAQRGPAHRAGGLPGAGRHLGRHRIGRRNEEPPQWIANLRHSARATIQIGRERQEVSAVVPQGAERDALWREVIEWKPFFQDYERKSGRVIPVAVLTPLGAGTS